MNRRRTLLLVTVGLGLAGGLAFLFWSKQSDQALRLRIVRRAVEAGKPVVFFRIEGAEDRRIKINDVEKVAGNTSEGPVFGSTALLGPRILISNFWAESSPMPMFDSRKARREFGVVAPTNAPNWTLRVSVVMEGEGFNRFELDSLKRMLGTWNHLRLMGMPSLKAAQVTWNAIYHAQNQSFVAEVFITTFRGGVGGRNSN